MVFAAAGLSSLKGNDFCNTNRTNGGAAFKTQLVFFPPGRECSVPRTGAPPVERKAGDAIGFFAILAAGLLLLGIRRSPLAVATAAVFGMTGLTALGVSLVPAFGFGWMIGGILALSLHALGAIDPDGGGRARRRRHLRDRGSRPGRLDDHAARTARGASTLCRTMNDRSSTDDCSKSLT